MFYVNGLLKYCYYLIPMSIIVDYKKYVYIIGIKVNVEYFVYHITL